MVYSRNLLIGLTLLLHLSAGSSAPGEEVDDYAVYRAVLSERFELQGDAVVRRETLDAASYDFNRTAESLTLGNSDSRRLDSLIESFRKVRSSNVNLEPDRLGSFVGTVLTSEEIDLARGATSYWEWDRWHAFSARYGARKILTLSRVAFLDDGTWAMFSVSTFCGPLCGTGCYFLLERTDGEWLVKAEEITWIS